MNIAPYIDHTILKPGTTSVEVLELCREAIQYGFAAVCVPPFYIGEAAALLEHTTVKTATVIGFPFGYSATASKLCEIEEALENGAEELDMVMNLAAAKNGTWDRVAEEVAASARRIHSKGKVMKLIVESGMLTEAELLKACEIVAAHKVDYIKTSTGFTGTGATVHAVQLMRKQLPDGIRIKASGGIRTFGFAKELIDAGADRLGCSAGVSIIGEQRLQT